MISTEANAWEESAPGRNVEGTIGGGQSVGDGMQLTAMTGGPAQEPWSNLQDNLEPSKFRFLTQEEDI